MRVLVFGGTRFIGRAIVERLLRDGHEVTLLNRGLSADPFGTAVKRVVGDRRDPQAISRAASRRDYDAAVDITAYHESETSDVVTAFRERVGHLIHISTAAVYLIRRDLLPPYREDDFSGPLAPRRPGDESSWRYADHKRRCEQVLESAWREHRFPSTSLRLPMVVGPHDYSRRTNAYLERLASSGPLILPEGGLNAWGFLWVDDVADAVAASLANPVTFGRAYNLAQREALTLRQFVELAARFLDRTVQLISLPTQWLNAIGLGTSFSPYSHDSDMLLDCAAAGDDLLFRPTEAVRWIESLVRAFRDEWDGTLRAFAATRAFELTLVREVERIRLPSYQPAPAK
jgi:nucleoside-diphosphate-sugar epimerase